MQKSSLVTLLAIFIFLAVAGVFTYQVYTSKVADEKNEAKRVLGGGDVPVSYTDLEGNSLEIENYQGKILLVNSWASWCPLCVDELRDLNILMQDYSESDVVVLAINRKESKEQAQRFIRSLGDVENIKFVIDTDDHFFQTVGGYAMPETIFFDRSGTQIHHKRGVLTVSEAKELIDQALSSN